MLGYKWLLDLSSYPIPRPPRRWEVHTAYDTKAVACVGAQVTYNLKNSLVWLVLFPYFSPTRTPNLFMLAGKKGLRKCV